MRSSLFSAAQNSFPSPSQSVFPPTDHTPAAVSPKITKSPKDSNYTDPIRLQSNQPPRHDSFDDVSIQINNLLSALLNIYSLGRIPWKYRIFSVGGL